MSDQAQPPASTLVIPADVQEKFSELVDLIKGSESMNTEERQYWINILPVMTPDQIKNLHDILSNEKQQLAAIDAKYNTGTEATPPSLSPETIEEKIKTKKKERQEKEQAEATKEVGTEEDLLKQIASL